MGRASSMLRSTMREYNFIIQPILFQYLEVSSDCMLRKALPATAWAGRIIGCHYSVNWEHQVWALKFHSATPDRQLPNPNALFSTSSVPSPVSRHRVFHANTGIIGIIRCVLLFYWWANMFLSQMEHVITCLAHLLTTDMFSFLRVICSHPLQ